MGERDEQSGVAESELTDEEVISTWEATVSGISDGTIPIFDDKEAFITDALRRLGQ